MIGYSFSFTRQIVGSNKKIQYQCPSCRSGSVVVSSLNIVGGGRVAFTIQLAGERGVKRDT